ncbi:MAG: DoxX family membrane protein [Fluviicola sp.]|nr:DoxX family membrane protein [Fluviicola sp.]
MTLKRQQIIDFIILALRFYIAFFMIDYGYEKATGGQFGVDDQEILNKPLKDVDKFYIAWYLFSQSSFFDITVGISQIIGGLLIVFNRTVLLGAFALLPILFQILLMDIAFTTNIHGSALPIRLTIMILCDFAIIYYHKDKVISALKIMTSNSQIVFKYKWWAYIILVLLAVPIDLFFGLLSIPFKTLINYLLNK